MSVKNLLLSGTALVVFSPAAFADVTAQDIWTDWKDYWSGFGYSVNATEQVNGDNITVSNITMAFPMPEGEGSFDFTVEKIDFVSNGDGTVKVVLPASIPISFAMNIEDEANVEGTLNYETTGFDMVASGDPSEITYKYDADEMRFGVSDLQIDGQPIGGNIMRFAAKSMGLAGTSIMKKGALRTIDQTMSLGETSYSFNFADPESSDTFAMDGKMATMNFTGVTSIPENINIEDMTAALTQGLAFEGSFGYTKSATTFAVAEDGEPTNGKSGTDAAEITIKMNKDMLQYMGSSKGVDLEMVGADIPLPVSAEMGEIGFNLLMPVAKSDDESDFALGVTLADFVTSDMIWSMFDPGEILPRDPATVSFDMTGKAKMLVDLFDEEQMAAVEDGDEMPAELNALTLNNLLVSMAGAKLTGDGGFTFDNTNLTMFDGMPKPTGKINARLEGGNGLMDKLVQMGLLPEEQAMGARMMMGLFARPGDGPDTLTSTLEINEEGHILANGQRIQ